MKVRIKDLEFHTENFGSRKDPTLLLISGAMAPARFWTDVFCNRLAENGFFVIRYDHRDIGESSSIDWQQNPYTLSDLAADALNILDTYGITKAHFVGHSMGGYICQRIAVDFPERVLSIIPISAGPISADENPLSVEEQSVLNKTWEIFLARKDEETIQSYLSVWRYLNGKVPFDEDMANAYTLDLLTRTHHKMRAGNNHELVMRSLSKYSGILEKISVPTLIIHGTEDYLSLPRDGIAIAKGILNSKLVMIPDMGHMLFNRELEAKIALEIINFL